MNRESNVSTSRLKLRKLTIWSIWKFNTQWRFLFLGFIKLQQERGEATFFPTGRSNELYKAVQFFFIIFFEGPLYKYYLFHIKILKVYLPLFLNSNFSKSLKFLLKSGTSFTNISTNRLYNRIPFRRSIGKNRDPLLVVQCGTKWF